jgi:hypothetical protein
VKQEAAALEMGAVRLTRLLEVEPDHRILELEPKRETLDRCLAA